jgi:hypothetical protein
MTLFILTLIFTLNFMTGMIQPYSSTAGESVDIADRSSDRIYTDTLSSSGQPPGYFNYTHFSDFFENYSTSEIRTTLGLPDTRDFNITVSSDYTSYGTKEGLVSYWPLNERRSEEAADVAGEYGERLYGEVQGNVTTDVRGISSSGAYRFDGPDAAVNVSADPELNPADTGNLTLSVWVKPDASQPADFATIAAKGVNSGYQMHLEDTGGASRNPVFEGGATGSPPEAQWYNPLDAGEWHHIVGIYQNHSSAPENEYLELYVNGDLKVTNWENGSDDAIAAAPGDSFGIGNNLQDANRHFNGDIDEVRLYDRVLSEDEIREIYQKSGILSLGKPDIGSHDSLDDTKYVVGDKIPSGQDIASVSSRTRVGYIGKREEVGSDDGGGGGGRSTQRVEFPIVPGSPSVGNSLDTLEIVYPNDVDVTPLINECADSTNAQNGISPPCPGLIEVGLDTNGDGTTDVDATGEVECCPPDPDPNVGDGVMVPSSVWTDTNGLRIELGNGPNLDAGDTVVAEYPIGDPKARTGCSNAEVTVNADSENNQKSLNVCGDSESGDGSSDIGTVEVKIKVW